MHIDDKVPFVNEDLKMNKALLVLNNKKLGILIIQNRKKLQKVLLQMVKLEG